MAADREHGGAAMKAALAAQKDARIRAMLNLAKTEPGMSCSVTELDADAHLLGVENGVVDLRSGQLLAICVIINLSSDVVMGRSARPFSLPVSRE